MNNADLDPNSHSKLSVELAVQLRCHVGLFTQLTWLCEWPLCNFFKWLTTWYMFILEIAMITQEIQDSPLPQYSPLCMRYLCGADNIPEAIWNSVIAETAHYYFGKWPNICDSQHYRVLGSRICTTYLHYNLMGRIHG